MEATELLPKRMDNRKLLTALVCLMPFCGMRAQAISHVMYVNLADGKVDTYVVKENLKVSLWKGEVNVSSESLSTVYKADDVVDYTFADLETGIEDVAPQPGDVEGVKVVYLDNETVLIYGAEAHAVQVYSAGGVGVKANVENADGGVAVSLRSLPAGTYIISINKEKSIKVVKR